MTSPVTIFISLGMYIRLQLCWLSKYATVQRRERRLLPVCTGLTENKKNNVLLKKCNLPRNFKVIYLYKIASKWLRVPRAYSDRGIFKGK